MTDSTTALAHKDRTVQDILDDMSPEQKDLQALILGAAVEDEVITDQSVIDEYDALSTEHKFLIDFLVGGILANESLKHGEPELDNFLAHVGVKGMKWGVRKSDISGGTSSAKPRKAAAPLVGNGTAAKLSGSTMNTEDNRAAARKKVRKGTATAEETHVAALKSTGHRVLNAFLGDKTYWKGAAITLGVAGATVAAGAALPAVLPASALAAIGNATVFAMSGGMAGASGATATAYGVTGIAAVTTGAAYIGTTIASSVLGVTNLVRAVRGNSRIDSSYEKLGNAMVANQTAGAKRTAKILSKDGGLAKRKVKKTLKQSDDLKVGAFLEHYANTPVVHALQEV